MEERSHDSTPIIGCDQLGDSALAVLEPRRYDFQAMLAEFNQVRSQPTKYDSRRLSPTAIRRQKSYRSPYRNNYWDKIPSYSPAVHIVTPPTTPKRRKTEATLENYTGDEYQIDFARLDLCAQVRMLRTVDDTSDEEALTWSSSDDECEEAVAKAFRVRSA